MQSDITSGLQSVSSAGAVTGTLDTSGIPAGGECTVFVRVPSLPSGKSITITLQDSANGTFSDAQGIVDFSIAGQVQPTSEIILSFAMPRHLNATAVLPNSIAPSGNTPRYGSANNKMRIYVSSLSGSTTAQVHGWLVY